jgi:hypothetical protein
MARRRRQRTPKTKPAAEVDFSNLEQTRAWFEGQTREVCIALAVRAALRVLPQIEAVPFSPSFETHVAFPVLRTCFVAWVIAEYPTRRGDLRSAAVAASTAAHITLGYTTSYANRVAHSAAALEAAAATVVAADAATAITAAATARAAATASARAATASARAAIAARADAVEIEQGHSVTKIVAAPLWPGEMPQPIIEAWDRLHTWMLGDEANHWDPGCSGTSECATGNLRSAKCSTSPSPR